MAEVKETKTAPAVEMEYVEIPAKDLFDNPHPAIWNNKREFKPGKHLVSPDDAAYIRERLKIFQAEQIRQLRPNSDPRVRTGMRAEDTY